MPVDPKLVKQFQAVLARMTAKSRYPPSLVRREAAKVRKLVQPGWLVALERAIARGKTRRRAAADLLAELIDLPEVVEHFIGWLGDPDVEWRVELLEFIGEKRLRPLAPAINAALDDPDLVWCAISTAGKLQCEVNLPGLLRVAQDVKTPGWSRLLWALHEFPHPVFHGPLLRFFHSPFNKDAKVRAAWALGKQGDAEAIRYLGEMLYDPEIETPTSYDPGESCRAAQALSDIHGWPFTWGQAGINTTRRRWRKLRLAETGGQSGEG
jgi:hypothetical protein